MGYKDELTILERFFGEPADVKVRRGHLCLARWRGKSLLIEWDCPSGEVNSFLTLESQLIEECIISHQIHHYTDLACGVVGFVAKVKAYIGDAEGLIAEADGGGEG